MCTTKFLNMIADNVFNTKTTPALPKAYYLGLGKTKPELNGTGATELSGGGYKRILISGLGSAVDGVVKNGVALNFTESTADQGTATYYYIYSAQTGGDLLMYGQLSESRHVENKTVVSIKANELNLSVVNVTT